jgi:2-polyprenyl-3-methyl-5-hydroxy-6-metoxy-1,4-benzoquinol methylase
MKGSAVSASAHVNHRQRFPRAGAMSESVKPGKDCEGCNSSLLRAVPTESGRILEVGCAGGRLGAALKAQDPSREVFGIEREPAVAARAGEHLDRVFVLDVERDDPALEKGCLDCILYGDVLEHFVDPEAVLRRHRQLLAPGGCILCSVPNVQHHSVVAALLQSDFQYTDTGLLDATHLRFFTYSTLVKLLLDAGYVPSFLEDVATPPPPELMAALGPVLRHLGLHEARTRRYLSAYQYVVRGTPLVWEAPHPDAPEGCSEKEEALSFVVCVSDEARLRANLLSSPCLRPGSPHEVLAFRGCPSAAEGLNEGLRRARNRIVVCVHQDVYLPRGWPQRFLAQYRQAEAMIGKVGVAGVYGISRGESAARRAGHVVDRDRLLEEPAPLPARVDTLDEMLLALPRETPFSFDPRLGFHLYGADISLAARQRGMAAVALDAVCFHNSLGVGLPPDFLTSAAVFRGKWAAELPVVTPCVLFKPNGQLCVS